VPASLDAEFCESADGGLLIVAPFHTRPAARRRLARVANRAAAAVVSRRLQDIEVQSARSDAETRQPAMRGTSSTSSACSGIWFGRAC
jgi:hypothetical protein